MTESHSENLRQALEKARREISLLDPTWMASRSGTVYDFSETAFEVPFFDEFLKVSYPAGLVERVDRRGVTDTEALICLHYLIQADGTPVRHEWVAYRDLPGARYHEPAFVAEVERPLSLGLAGRLQALREWSDRHARTLEIAGDIALAWEAFPHIPLLIIFNEQDEEFPASARVLFDISAPNYLPTEDLSILAEIAAARLLAGLQLLSDGTVD
ncbi:MAG: hypothetical protein A2V52_01715 [Actinobacteria bacterium RBG_19FT_COMBO_54_7]|uniref:DUF3786 domain-containing protein n=1 Tax=Candidatus Solincola sediminis TaxID=1797199 RepID=A0A1F2WFV6_9ACTN|nr:MAG: hypothetical protein A2Y75_06050 [Candidatus Solincola sediminis]OFW60011.1 MAG: hypothetical protein A2W01_10470 [Candidatus Solincola sediminis]OFW67745.1 MAG: hypothetical protein A2V52_01715 [Actinobacteria bacterium RBG_19FT_COMBO_54_7]